MMTDANDPGMPEAGPDTTPASPPAGAPGATRRGALMLGALGASAIVTIRPALAQTAGSVLNCEIPVPDPAGNWVDADGKMVAPNTPGAFPGGRIFRGEEVKAVKRSMNMRPLPGTEADQSRAYMRYIGRLQNGQSGFTCFASLTVQNR